MTNNDDQSIDLMATSSESEIDEELTADDLAFYDDEIEENDLSFYRALANQQF